MAAGRRDAAEAATVLADLRERIRRIERDGPGGGDGPRGTGGASVLPFGVPALDRCLPAGGLALGVLHEVADGSAAGHPAAALFVAGVLARLPGPVLWCLGPGPRGFFPPGLAGVGLHPDRVLYVEAAGGGDALTLLVMEEGLRHGGLGSDSDGGGGLAAVVGDVTRLGLTASRRLQLAAGASGVTAFVLRPGHAVAAGAGATTVAVSRAEPSAAVTRWQIAPLPSAPLPAPVPGLGRARWRVDLVRCRGGSGEPASLVLEACDAQGRLALPAELADGCAAPARPRRAGAR